MARWRVDRRAGAGGNCGRRGGHGCRPRPRFDEEKSRSRKATGYDGSRLTQRKTHYPADAMGSGIGRSRIVSSDDRSEASMNDDHPAPPSPAARAAANPRPNRFPTVGIGTSAGGVQALQMFFESLPDDVDAAFVVIVHLDPEHQSELPNIFATRTKMPVTQVADRERLQPGRVYVIPPNRQIASTDHHLDIAEFDEPRWRRAPIDLFFRSLAAQRGDDFAIVLTGAGSDGALGIKAVKEAGGLILVQDPDEAEYGSMPRSAIATGLADFVLPVREIAARLPELIRNRGGATSGPPNEDDERGRSADSRRICACEPGTISPATRSPLSAAASFAACRSSARRR